jgi:dihydrolipoamide dehydrogenase
MTQTDYDVIIIGGGPGGYVAADRLGVRGFRVLLIERDQLGGVCLNAGCIPTKALLYAAKLYTQALNASKYGVEIRSARFNWAAAQERKASVVANLRDGVAYQMGRRSVTVVSGAARVLDRQTVAVDDVRYRAQQLIIATGASPYIPDLPGVDLPHVHTTTGILSLEKLPRHLVVLGGGAIALGVATIFGLVGVNVHVVEAGAQLLPTLDSELTAMLAQELAAQNIVLHLSTQATAITPKAVQCRKPDGAFSLPADAVLLCLERRPNVDGLGLERIDLDYSDAGVRVDEQMRTNVPNVYAVGDVTGLSMWAHSAARMGEVAAATIAGRKDRFRLEHVPVAVYTYPEIASVGLTEQAAKAQGLRVKTARLPFNANGRFMTEHEGRRGLCKVVVDADTRALLGVHMIGATCSEQIFGAAAMLEDEFRLEDAQQVVFAHPTIAEIIRDTLFEVNL